MTEGVPHHLGDFLLKLPEKTAHRGDGKHYSWNQLSRASRRSRIRQNKSSPPRRRIPARRLRPRYPQTAERADPVHAFKNTVRPQDTVNFYLRTGRLRCRAARRVAAVRNQQNGQPYRHERLQQSPGVGHPLQRHSRNGAPLIIRRTIQERDRDGWSRMGEVLMAHVRGEALPPPWPRGPGCPTPSNRGTDPTS